MENGKKSMIVIWSVINIVLLGFFGMFFGIGANSIKNGRNMGTRGDLTHLWQDDTLEFCLVNVSFVAYNGDEYSITDLRTPCLNPDAKHINICYNRANPQNCAYDDRDYGYPNGSRRFNYCAVWGYNDALAYVIIGLVTLGLFLLLNVSVLLTWTYKRCYRYKIERSNFVEMA